MRSHARPIPLFRCVWLVPLMLGCPYVIADADQPSVPPARPFSIHDTNADGYLSPQEYAALLELRCAHRRARFPTGVEPAPTFEALDCDRNGLIDETELTDALRWTVYQRRGPRWRYPSGGR